MAFVLAGFMCSGAEYAVRSYLNYVGSEAVVGLYNAAYMLVVTYAGMVFSAMETDYFPRLSAACQAYIVDCKTKYPLVNLGDYIEESDERNSDLSIHLSQVIFCCQSQV